MAGLGALCVYPPAWHAGLRTLAAEAAARRGLRLETGAAEGGPLDGIVFHDVRLRGQGGGTDLRARRVELYFTPPALPYFERPKGSLLRRLVVEGLEGDVVLAPTTTALDSTTTAEEPSPSPLASRPPWQTQVWKQFGGLTTALAGQLVPAEWNLHNRPEEEFRLLAPAAGGELRARGLQLTTGEPGGPGFFSVAEVEAHGPGGLAHRSGALHGAAGWQGTWLTLREVALSPGVTLDHLTLETIELVRRGRLQGDALVRALGGELRAEGTAGPGAQGRPELALAGSLSGVAVLPLANLLGVRAPVALGGTVRAGQFSYRGDPGRPATEATGFVRAEVLDFQLGPRAWQRLLVAATVLGGRATVHDLELVQGPNRLGLAGEFPVIALADPANGWRAGGVAGRVDARLGDLRLFGQLLGPAFPALAGRLELRGELRDEPGDEAFPEGSFQVEGGPLTVRGVPLDRLRGNVRLRHGELEVDGLQATGRAGDTLTGKGAFRAVGGPFRYAAEARVHVKDLALYAAALPTGWFPAGAAVPPRGSLTGEWNGDGGTGSHAGAFKGRLGGFLAPPGGPVALPRPVDVEVEGTYSPESIAFRRFLLRDGADPKAEFHLRLERGALPWTQDASARAGGQFFQSDGTLMGRVEWRDFALDLLPPLFSPSPPTAARFGPAPGTDGRLTGWVDLAGTPHAPRLTGAGQLRKARLRWRDPALRWAEADGLSADFSLDGGDHARIERGVAERPATAGGGGAVTFGGGLAWSEAGAPLDLDLSVQLKDHGLLDDRTVRVRTDADLFVRGTSDAPKLIGEMRLREGGRFWRRLEFAPEPSPVTPGAWSPAATLAAVMPTFLADATLDLHVGAAGPLLLEGANGVRGEGQPDLRVTGPGRWPTLAGEVALRRTKVFLPSAEMNVEEGTVRFDPERAPDDVLLNLPARKSLPPDRKGEPARVLRADFAGPASEGQVAFSAEPPVWSPEAVGAFLTEEKLLPPATAATAVGASPASPESGGTANPDASQVTPRLYLRLR